MKAVIPAAGLGTRLLPATKNSPKEMLPLVDKPVIQYVVEEAVASGFTDILIITGRGKRAIEDHFDRNIELEAALEKRGDQARLREIRRIGEMANIHFIRQSEPLGLGHAVLCARDHIGQEPFALLLGDDVVVAPTPCTKQLWDVHQQTGKSVVAIEQTAPERIESYGVIDPGATVGERLYEVRSLVEKPRRDQAPSNLAVMGRYVLTPTIFDILSKLPPGRNGEVQLTDALRELVGVEGLHAYKFEGRRFDLGDKLEWLKSNIEVAMMDADLRSGLAAFLRTLDAAPSQQPRP